MRKIDEKAAEVAAALNEVGYGIDPLVIAAIIGAVLLLFKDDCKLPFPEALRRAQNPRRLDLLRLRRLARRHGVRDVGAAEAALLDCAEGCGPEDFEAMYGEVT